MNRNQKYQCNQCKRYFSDATFTPEYAQKKPYLNDQIETLLSSGVCQNQIARILKINRKTVARKLVFLGKKCQSVNQTIREALPLANTVVFDELETFEHTKCKPYSVAVAVDEHRVVRAFQVSEMPASGKLAKISRKKYGQRKDFRRAGIQAMWNQLKPQCHNDLLILSDKSPRYRTVIRSTFAKESQFRITYNQFKGRPGRDTAQGELKQGHFDPLFRINHTFAKFRAGISRLIRKTWNTTKDITRFIYHLHIFICYHNRGIIKKIDNLSNVPSQIH